MMEPPPRISRREMAALAAVLGGMGSAGPALADTIQAAPMRMGPQPAATGPRLKVALLVHPGMVLLDMVGPQTVLNIAGGDIFLAAKSLEPVSTDVGLPIAPTVTYQSCPRDLDVLMVPGGLMGSIACMGDKPTLDFLNDRAASAKYVTSVCTGGLVLAAAGLLRGYRATAHWGVADLLPIMGAVQVHERVVQDRNRLTGAGVTAGIDFGLTLLALLKGADEAKRVQLIMEYSPRPPFKAGTPDEVGPAVLAEAKHRRALMDQDAKTAAIAAARRLGISA